MAHRDPVGDQRRGPAPAGRDRETDFDTTGRGGGGLLQRGPRAVVRGGRPIRRLRFERARVRRRRPRHDGHRRRRRHRHDVLHRRRQSGDLRARARTEPPRRGHDPRALAAIDGPLHGGRMDRVPRRRPVLHPLREDRGHGGRLERRPSRRDHRLHRGGRAACRRGPRPEPAVRRFGGHPRDRHRREIAPAPCGSCRRPARLRLFELRAGPRRVPHDPAARCNSGGAQAL